VAFEIYFMKWQDGVLVEFATEPVRRIFERYGISEFGNEYFELPSGQSLEMHATFDEPNETGFSVLFRTVSPELFQLIYELCANRLTALIVDKPYIPLVSNIEDGNQLPRDLPDYAPAILCCNSQDVEMALLPPFQRWENWAFGPR
jgi:hypothetical protein